MNTCCVYKIFCKDSSITKIYIGSTKNIKDRIYRHKLNCNNKNNSTYRIYHSYVYIFIRENGGIDNWEFEVLENCIETELKQKEQKWITNLKPELNCYAALKTLDEVKEYKKQYRIEKKEYLKQYKKNYYEANKDAIIEKVKAYKNSLLKK